MVDENILLARKYFEWYCEFIYDKICRESLNSFFGKFWDFSFDK